jgi:serine/threonine protein kinase
MDSRAVLARFDAERQALALMDHPNIAPVYDGGTTEAGQPFFVMELVAGEPITEYCDRNRLPVRARLELFVSVCQAVQHAQQNYSRLPIAALGNLALLLYPATSLPFIGAPMKGRIASAGVAGHSGQSSQRLRLAI